MTSKKPNILIIRGDDIGWFNISAYNHGLMVYHQFLFNASMSGMVFGATYKFR
jgi:arylsulfatase A-like enzyme